jgi:hypothetical protein
MSMPFRSMEWARIPTCVQGAGVSRREIYDLLKQDVIRSALNGRNRLIYVPSLLAYIEEKAGAYKPDTDHAMRLLAGRQLAKVTRDVGATARPVSGLGAPIRRKCLGPV